MRAEIRCCCDPGKLLGFVDIDRSYIYEGEVLLFVLRSEWSLQRWWETDSNNPVALRPPEPLRLPVAFVHGFDRNTGEPIRGLAIKSNDTPIETLRRIVGFQEYQP